MKERLLKVEEVENLNCTAKHNLEGDNGSRLSMTSMLNALGGWGGYDGYKITTTKNTYLILIDNGQCCCESWGYICSEDNINSFNGSEVIEVRLTDKALNTHMIEKSDYYEEGGGIQFIDFVTDKGTLQFAVYNSHNGYYGHGIYVVREEEVLLNDCL